MVTKQIFYAAVGAGDLAIKRARESRLDFGSLRSDLPSTLKKARSRAETTANSALKRTTETYSSLVKRGERTIRGMGSSRPTQRVIAQTKTARSRTKAAATSSKKAAEATVEAAKAVAGNL